MNNRTHNEWFCRCNQSTSVPESIPFYQNNRNKSYNLQVPHQNEVPMGYENTIMMDINMNPQRYFKCPDGSIFDLVTRKKVVGSKVEQNDAKNSGMTWTERFHRRDDDWGRINDMLRRIDPIHPRESMMGMNKDDIEYQEMTKKKSDELVRNMTDEQVNVLNNLEKFIGKNTVETT